MSVRFTPFHSRTAASNPFNRWTARNGFTLPLDFGDATAEALCARTRVTMSDISWRWRVVIQGASACDMLTRVLTRDPRTLQPGQSIKALWLNDGGAVRGAGVVSCLASDKFLLTSAASDLAWMAAAASLSGNAIQDVTADEGGLALAGPYAAQTLQSAGLPNDIEPLGLRKIFWRGLDLTITRWGEHGGYELWCKADDCPILWDRVIRAGAAFGIQAAGIAASDILDVEAGVPRPNRDYACAADGFGRDPTPDSVGLESLIDTAHAIFNGRAAWMANRSKSKAVLIGVELESEVPASFTPLQFDKKIVGNTLTSVYSPLLRRAIALARIDRSLSKDGMGLTVVPPVSLESPEPREIVARVRSLPFVESPPNIPR